MQQQQQQQHTEWDINDSNVPKVRIRMKLKEEIWVGAVLTGGHQVAPPVNRWAVRPRMQMIRLARRLLAVILLQQIRNVGHYRHPFGCACGRR